MAITTVERAGKKHGYRVKYREHGKQKYKTFDKWKDARDFESKQRLRKQGVEPERSNMTLQELWEKWDEVHGSVNLEPETRAVYKRLWDLHVRPHLGDIPICALCDDPLMLEEWRAQRTRVGVGNGALRKTLLHMQSVLEKGMQWKIATHNPARGIKKPPAKRVRAVRPLTTDQVWALIEVLTRREDKLLVGLMGFAGLRPGEALALTWADVKSNTLIIDKSRKPGRVKSTKTGSHRSVRISLDLAKLLALCGRRPPEDRVVDGINRKGAPRFDQPHDWKNWQRRDFKKAITSVEGLPEQMRPYDLRHSRASQLIKDGKDIVTVAAQMGHSPEMTLSTYAHVFEETFT